MDTKVLIEAFGYLGSALVVISMLMTSVLRLRIINTIGSVIFAIYALIIHSYPTALMNFFLVGINIYHLLKLRNVHASYTLTEVNPTDRFLEMLIASNRADIEQYFPDYFKKEKDGTRAFIIMHDHEVAGFTVAKQLENETLDLYLDYSTPAYRDCSVGLFEYDELRTRGVRKFIYTGNNPDHIQYVEKIGFKKNEEGVYVLNQ